MTIRELFREFAIASARRRDERDAALSLAWHTAVLQRIEKIPPLHTLVARAQRTGPQTIPEQSTMLQLLSDRLGIPLTRVRLIRKDVA
jgi:hypothetical protein